MPAQGHKVDRDVLHRAAEVHLGERLSIAATAERFGISARSVKKAVHLQRKADGTVRPRRGRVAADPHSLASLLGEHARQDDWLTCCQSADCHRFDCPDRGCGQPYLPMSPVSPPAQLVDRVRAERARSTP